MPNSKYHRILLSLALFAGSLSLIPVDAHAQQSTLTVNPPLLEIEAVPPTSIEAPITIRNDSRDSIELQVLLRPFTAYSENGDIEFLDPDDPKPGANPKITERVMVREQSKPVTTITLAPKEEKTLDLYIGIEKGEPHSDYYFAVLFLPPDTSTADEENVSSVRGGIAVNVLLSIGPKDEAKGLIEEFSGPRLLNSGPVPFTVRVKNTGSRYITPRGTIIVSNMFGQKIGKVALLPANILPGTIRGFTSEAEYKDKLKKERDAEEGGKEDASGDLVVSPVVVWPETFLVGPYNATLRVSLSPKGPELVREYRFFAFPAQLLLGIIITIFFLLIIRRRVKRKLS